MHFGSALLQYGCLPLWANPVIRSRSFSKEDIPALNRFKSDPLFMGNDWNKHQTKATLVGVPNVFGYCLVQIL